jgi:predicted ferric reductase
LLSDGGIHRFSSLVESMTSLGIMAGPVGTDLICIMLLLAARVPVVDRSMGHDRALKLHSSLGKPVLYLLVLHGILLTFGYAATDGTNFVSETLTLFTTIADMQLAYLGLGLLVVVAISSVVAVRRRFPYEVWQGIHLLTYAGTAASIPHQFSTGGLFLPGTAQRWYWLACTRSPPQRCWSSASWFPSSSPSATGYGSVPRAARGRGSSASA